MQEELISKYFGRCLFSGADETRILGVATDKEVKEPTQWERDNVRRAQWSSCATAEVID